MNPQLCTQVISDKGARPFSAEGWLFLKKRKGSPCIHVPKMDLDRLAHVVYKLCSSFGIRHTPVLRKSTGEPWVWGETGRVSQSELHSKMLSQNAKTNIKPNHHQIIKTSKSPKTKNYKNLLKEIDQSFTMLDLTIISWIWQQRPT